MANIATAYVQIVPTTKGISGSLTSTLEGEASSAGDSAGSLLGNGLVTKVLGVIAAAKIGEKIVSTISDAVSSGAALEQSIGGMQTLFKDASDTMLAQAKNAYSTAGMSANEYMETATQFSASLIKSCGGDTEKAAAYADKAIVQMSDNANKMGTNIEDIQNAYRGFAKENYTMLDNLSLGYSGTKEGMESLLKDAEAISGVKYDISSYSDIVDAIGVIQDSFGVTGTTAKEAEGTIEGSLNSMKAAWDNLLAGMTGVWEKSGEEFDLAGAVNTLAQTISTSLFGNLIPAVGSFIVQIPAALSTFISTAWQEIGAQLQQATGATDFSSLLSLGVDALNQFITGIMQSLPELLQQGGEIITNLISGILQHIPEILESAGEIVLNLWEGIQENAPALLENFGQFVANLVPTILEHLPDIITAGFELISALISGILPAIPTLVPEMVMGLFNGIASGLSGVDWGQLGMDILNALINGILGLLGSLSSTLSSIWTTISGWTGEVSGNTDSWVSELISSVTNWFMQLPGKILGAITPAIQNVIQWGANLVSSGISAASNFISRVASTVAAIPGRIWSAIVGAVSRVAQWGSSLASAGRSAASSLVSNVVSGVSSLPSRMISVGSNIVHGIISGVENAAGALLQKMQNLASNALNAAKNALGIKSPSRVFRDQVGQWIPAGIAAGISGNSDVVDKALEDLTDPLASELNSSVKLNAAATASGLRNAEKETISPSSIYAAVKAGMQDATIVTNLNGREVGRTLKGMGVSFA